MRFAVFDIETRVDKALLRDVFFSREAIDEEEAFRRMRDQLSGSIFPISLQVPISIAWGEVGAGHELQSIRTLGEDADPERSAVREFWELAERQEACLVTFNGRRFDLPVLELHALRLGLSAPRYFARRTRGDGDYHLDLLDFLTNRGAFGIRGGLNLLTKAIGLAGKGEINGAQVQGLYEDGRLDEIHRYCRRDVAQTYCLFLRVELLRGRLDPRSYRQALERSAACLAAAGVTIPAGAERA